MQSFEGVYVGTRWITFNQHFTTSKTTTIF